MQNFIVDFHFLGISQNSLKLSLIVFVVLILINKLLYFKCKTLDYFPNTKFGSIKRMSGQTIISIISTNLGPFGANSGITVGQSSSIR